MTIKNCLYCKHCYVWSGSPGYSEYTPGDPMSMGCNKHRWELDEYSVGKETLAQMLNKAETCPDFEDETK